MTVIDDVARLLNTTPVLVADKAKAGELVVREDYGVKYAIARWIKGAPVLVLEPVKLVVPPPPQWVLEVKPRSHRAGVVGELLVGYGLRIVDVDGRLIAFRDNGLLCHYSTRNIEGLRGPLTTLLRRVVGREGVLYAVGVGASNPYNPFFHQLGKDFDIVIYAGWRQGEGYVEPQVVFQEASSHGVKTPRVVREGGVSAEELRSIIMDADSRDVAGIAVYEAGRVVGYPSHTLIVELVRIAGSRLDVETLADTLIVSALRIAFIDPPMARRLAMANDIAWALVESVWEAYKMLREKGYIAEEVLLRMRRRGSEIAYAVLEALSGYKPLEIEFREWGEGVEAVVKRAVGVSEPDIRRILDRLVSVVKA